MGDAMPTSAMNALLDCWVRSEKGIICIDRQLDRHLRQRRGLPSQSNHQSDVARDTFWEIYPHHIGTHLIERTYRAVMRDRGRHLDRILLPTRRRLAQRNQIYPTDEGIARLLSGHHRPQGRRVFRDASVRQLGQVLESHHRRSRQHRPRLELYLPQPPRQRSCSAPKGDLSAKISGQEFPVAAQHKEISLPLPPRHERRHLPASSRPSIPNRSTSGSPFSPAPSDDGIVVFFSDITARKQSDQHLKQQQELLAVVQHAALVATWDIDLVHRQGHLRPRLLPGLRPSSREIPDLESFPEDRSTQFTSLSSGARIRKPSKPGR